MEDIGSAVTHQDDDLVLVHASKRGDMAAFERLVERYHGKPMCIAQNVTHDINDAQEVVQDAFFKAYQKLDQFRETARFSTWLVRIALNGRERAEMARPIPNNYVPLPNCGQILRKSLDHPSRFQPRTERGS